MAAFRFRVDGKHENGDFRKRHDNHAISLTEFSSNINPKCPVIDTFLEVLQRNVDGKQLIRILRETSFFKFPRRSVDQ